MNTYGNTCPSCGRDKLSITIREDGTKLWHCFSASCGHSGGRSPDGVIPPPCIRSVRKLGNPYREPLLPLQASQIEMLSNEVGFIPVHIAIARPCWANMVRRVAFPLLNYLGQRQGWCLRSYEQAEPKALTFVDAESTKLSYYTSDVNLRTAILVEDIPSAVRAAPYINSVALLGTSIASDERHELSEHFDHIIIALDADATANAIRLQGQLACLFKQVDVLMLPCDIKDMKESEICQLLKPLHE